MPGRKGDDMCVDGRLDPEPSKKGWKLATRAEVATSDPKAFSNEVDQLLNGRRFRIYAPRRDIGILDDDPAARFQEAAVDPDLFFAAAEGRNLESGVHQVEGTGLELACE